MVPACDPSIRVAEKVCEFEAGLGYNSETLSQLKKKR
jgi:hypothetical protein